MRVGYLAIAVTISASCGAMAQEGDVSRGRAAARDGERMPWTNAHGLSRVHAIPCMFGSTIERVRVRRWTTRNDIG